VQADERKRLEHAVRELPLGLKLTVTLALEGFTADEIATVLGISASAAAVRLHRAKAALQDKLKERTT
jgi:RNA polymerase sigma-70 factor (ECF subfamily)